ncbi:uncharacterized protein LOC124899596 [Capsicum annuum]|uniref:uncharacterized protein LOC124899596 n=1 Tax=Capsicum annuum TaxID=4072 RepID=UPI001FB0A725|nr:uncharacterized protein LOC124899596 [Capsicum annuum]
MESGELSCDQSEVLISYLMNGRGKIHPMFIRNDRHVELYMICIDSDNSRPILRVKVFERSREEASTSAPPPPSPPPPPLPPNVDDTSMEYDFMGCDECDNSKDYEEKKCGGGEDGQLEPQRSHSFLDGTNHFLGQTFKDKKTLKLLLKQASVKISFNYTTLKSSKKYLRVRCVDRTCRWMVRECAIGELGWFHVHKYVGEHTCGIDHVTEKHKNVTVEVIASLILNFFVENKGPSPKEIERIVFRELHCRPSYWKCWMVGVITKNIVRGTPEHGYAVLPAFSYIFNGLNPGSINSLMVDEESGRFIYYFMAFGASIRRYAHMRKVVAVDDTHFFGKYDGVLLSVVAQDTQNHIYPLAYCVVDKENDASWGFFFEKLKAFVVDEPELCVISDRHAYTLEEFNDYFYAFKERCPNAVAYLEKEVGFEKWNRAHFLGNRFNFMTLNIVESLNSMLLDEREYPVTAIFNSIAHRFGEIFRKMYAEVDNSKTTFVPVAEMILRENMTKEDKLYVNNINESIDEFTVLGYGRSAKVNLSRWSCSCRKYNLVKLSCAHAMEVLRLKLGDEYGTSIYNYSSQIYSKESYLLAYLEPIYAAPLESEWSVAREYLEMQVLPLDFDPKLRRRKVKRVKGMLEPSRYKKRNKCSKCKRPGHKRTTCSLNVG